MNAAASLQINDDDLTEILVAIERSFAIELPRDLRYVTTVGDLHHEIMSRVGPPGGTACPTSMVFYALRSMLIAEGVPRDARPDLPLQSVSLRSPRATRRLLSQATGWEMPGLVVGWVGCIALLLGPIIAVAAWWANYSLLIAPVLAGALATLLRFDPGAWRGSWATLGSLARTIAAANHARLSGKGARHSPATTWQALVELLTEAMPERVAIAPNTRLLA